jgi:hypothetical protein
MSYSHDSFCCAVADCFTCLNRFTTEESVWGLLRGLQWIAERQLPSYVLRMY